MTDLAVSERRIRPIQDAAATGNWKQALQLCDKWQKKGEKSDRFLALKASILINQPDKSQLEKGKAETLQLCRRSTPVTDIEALYQLHDVLKRLSLQNEEGPKLWERASSAMPTDKDFLTAWLNGAITDSDWLMAQKAAMALRKAFPKERQYEFLNMLMCFLIHRDDSLPEKNRLLFGTLAYRLISKAAESVTEDKAQLLTPGKAISTPEELALLTEIYISTGNTQQAVDLLSSNQLGLMSRVAELDPRMVFSLLIRALESCNQQKIVLEACQKLLSEDAPGVKDHVEDDRIWQLVVGVARNNDHSYRVQCMNLLDAALSRQPDCRAAQLAKLDILTEMACKNTKPSEELLIACEEYLKIFQAKPFCFSDLVKALQACRPELARTLATKSIIDSIGVTEQSFRLKLEYTMLSEEESTENDFLLFAAKAFGLHKQFPIHRTECPEAALLAALTLIRLAGKTKDSVYALQASFILEYTYTKCGEYYPSAVRLVQLHRALGSVSLAMERFGSLSIKNIQWETVGHLFLTRISSLHPLQTGYGDDAMNPLGALDSGLNMLANAEKSLDKAIQKGLEFGSYSNVLDSIRVKHNIQNSLNRQIFAVEERKIHNLIGLPVEDVLEDRPKVMIDKRDFSFLEHYGVVDEKLDTVLNCGSLPGDVWLDAMIMCDHLAIALKLELGGHSTTATQAFDSLNSSYNRLAATDGSTMASMTDAEIASFRCHQYVSRIVLAARQPAPTGSSDIDEALSGTISWLSDDNISGTATINGVEIPTWKYLHICFTRLETIHIVALMIGFLSRKTKSGRSSKSTIVSKEKIAELQKALQQAESVVQQRTKGLKRGVNASGVLGKLVDATAGRIEEGGFEAKGGYGVLAKELADTYDEVALEEYCGKIKDSWEDSLDGILAVKIKVPK